jgi:WD40 repeat protein
MIHFLRMDEQRRFEIARSAIGTLGFDFSSGGTLHSWALLGPNRQLQILPCHNPLVKARDSVDKSPPNRNFSWNASGDEEILIWRRIYSLLRVSCRPRKHSGNARLTISADAVQLGLFSPPQTIVVVTLDEIVEVWNVQHWQEITAVSDLRKFTEQVQDALQ